MLAYGEVWGVCILSRSTCVNLWNMAEPLFASCDSTFTS